MSPIRSPGASGFPCPGPSWLPLGAATPWAGWDPSRWAHGRDSAQVTWKMGRNSLQEQGYLLGKSILDGMFREGNKGGERERASGFGEKQVQENKGKTRKMGLVLLESCSVHMSSQHSLSCLPFKLCFWWFSQVSAPHFQCPCAEAPSACPAMGLEPQGQHQTRARRLEMQAQTNWPMRSRGEDSEEMTGSCWGGPWREPGLCQLVAVCGGGRVPVLPVAAPPLPHNMNHWHAQVRARGRLYRLIAKTIWYGGRLMFWTSL